MFLYTHAHALCSHAWPLTKLPGHSCALPSVPPGVFYDMQSTARNWLEPEALASEKRPVPLPKTECSRAVRCHVYPGTDSPAITTIFFYAYCRGKLAQVTGKDCSIQG